MRSMGSKEDQELHQAVRSGDQSRVESLLASGTNVDSLFYGWTPLQLAIDMGNQEIATLLIDHGCDFEFHDENHKSPFEEAVLKKEAEVVDALLKKKVCGNVVLACGETPLTYAVKQDSLSLLNVLLQGGVNVNKSNKAGHPPLYLACRNGERELASALLAAKADVNSASSHTKGETPLITAVANEHKSVISLLLKKTKCNVDAQDEDGWTALWHAYSNTDDDICRMLLGAGANKNLPNNEGRTVVQDATDNDDEVMMEIFQKFNI